MQAFILAGGKGTRLAQRLAGKPKPLVDVCGTPLLERQVRLLEAHGVDDIVVLVNHAADQIEAFFQANSFSARVRIVDDGQPRGTAGAVMAGLDLMQERSLIVYGDTLFDIDVPHMLEAHLASGAEATLLLHPNDHPVDSDLVGLGLDGFVTAFHPHPHPPGANLRNLVNAAFYVVERAALERWRNVPTPNDFGQNLFPAMIDAGQRLLGYVSAEYIKDLGTPGRLDKVERHLSSGIVEAASRRNPQEAIFIDRDGTLNIPAGYISSPKDLELIPGVAEAMRRLNDAGKRTVLITNQPVVARGECDLETLDRIHGRLDTLLSSAGAYLDRIYFCPHHPDGGYPGEVAELKIRCNCRKPAGGMVEAAISDMGIERHRSWMVGDSGRDMELARRTGLLSAMVLTGEEDISARPDAEAYDFVFPDFAGAVAFILDAYPMLATLARTHVDNIGPGEIVVVQGEGAEMLAPVLRNELLAVGKHVVISRPTGDRLDLLTADTKADSDLIVVMPWQADLSFPIGSKSVRWIDSERSKLS